MLVEFGNTFAIEGYRDPLGEDPDRVLYRLLPGERVTSLVLPDGIGIMEAFATVVGAMTVHMNTADENARPSWIQSDSEGLLTLLLEHYHIRPEKNVRPATWGQTQASIEPAKAPKKTRRRSPAATTTETDED